MYIELSVHVHVFLCVRINDDDDDDDDDELKQKKSLTELNKSVKWRPRNQSGTIRMERKKMMKHIHIDC